MYHGNNKLDIKDRNKYLQKLWQIITAGYMPNKKPRHQAGAFKIEYFGNLFCCFRSSNRQTFFTDPCTLTATFTLIEQLGTAYITCFI
jgi:predicted house-cleaning NTP pyrophosphatase (Maf/HAM1 superfamily)